ncbi:MAG: DUF1549 domain-containing protein [Planctomycetota bacterium]
MRRDGRVQRQVRRERGNVAMATKTASSLFFRITCGVALVLPAALTLLGEAHLSAAPPSATTSKADGKSTAASDFNIAQVRTINEQIRRVWQDNQLVPSVAAGENEWCRRVYLDVLGRIPTMEEMREFLSSKEPDKKPKLVAKILYDEKYVEEYARNWTTIWTNILIGRNGGNEQRSLTSRPGMQKYLRDSFARNKPYDKMVYELITATGSSAPGTENFNGAVNFLAMKVNEEKGTLATAEIAKVFLGLQVQCTQCHNHPFNDWKQQKFWELNAFLRQTRALRRFAPGSRDVESCELVDEDFGGEGGSAEEADIYYELRNGLTKVAFPVFVDGTEIPRSGYVTQVNRRTELGKLVVKSEYLQKEVANRLWAHFLGYGFTKPVDDLGPHNQPTHPELLDYLGEQLAENSFNLKELIRWITLSEPYSLSSRITANNRADDPLLGETPKFTHFYLRQMRAEELYESLLVATEAHKTRGDYEEQEKAKNDWMRQFVIAFGNDEGTEATTFNGTIPQALMMFNGDLIKKAVSTEKGGFLHRVSTSNTKPAEKISYLFMAGLGRAPTKNEVDIANKLLVARGGDSTAALQDIFWALLNSNEFIFNH